MDDLLTRILDTEATARNTWLKLERIFLSNKKAKAVALETRFVNLTLSACSSVDDYCKQLKDLANQLTDVDQPISESRLVLQLVRGLSQEFDTTAALINSQNADWDLARTMLNDEVIRQAARQQQSSSVLVTPTAQTNPFPPAPAQQQLDTNNQPHHGSFQSNYRGRGRGRNNHRGRGRGRGYRGNPTGNPWSFTPPNQNQPYPQRAWWNTPPCPYPTQNTWRPNQPTWPPDQPQNSPAAAHYAGSSTGYDALSPSDLSQAFNTMQLQYTDLNSLIMDTGAERHVTENRGMIRHPDSFPVNTKLLVGNGHCLPIEGSGTGFLPILNRTYVLPNILYSPQVIKNLLSVRRFTRDNNVSVEFDPFGFSLKDLKTGRLLSRHNSTGDLYPVTPPTLPPQACSITSTTLPWHNRLGHPGTQVLDVLFRHFGFSCNKNKQSLFYNSCHLANIKRLPFYDSNSFTFSPFDIIHCDLWTSPIPSKIGYKYYMVLIDNFSNFVWIYPLKFKSEAFTTFTKFHRLIATQFNRYIKTF